MSFNEARAQRGRRKRTQDEAHRVSAGDAMVLRSDRADNVSSEEVQIKSSQLTNKRSKQSHDMHHSRSHGNVHTLRRQHGGRNRGTTEPMRETSRGYPRRHSGRNGRCDDDGHNQHKAGYMSWHWEATPTKYVKQEPSFKLPITVDNSGYPYGRMVKVMEKDIKLFAKDLDPRVGWGNQTKEAKRRLLQRMYAEYDVHGWKQRVEEKWYAPIITKALINIRFKLNALIDSNQKKPRGIKLEHWNAMVEYRSTREAQAKSEQMRAVSKARMRYKGRELTTRERSAIAQNW